ncbi:AEC family transporter [Sulfurimonas diazotrophicus]|uniref:AEC family transporter n=1 Tax=Sulfurimonas diazotrophicus TaxID=3131939 RepID=A0ABZ3HBD1_9BACT
MDIYVHTLSSMLVLTCIILLVAYLRRSGMFSPDHGTLFASLITQLTLPALIFYALSHAALEWKYLLVTGLMMAGEMLLFMLAWGVSSVMGLSAPKTGSFILAAVFGSSTLLGYALVAELFGKNAEAMAEASLVSELGVGLPLFTLGAMIAMHYGGKKASGSGGAGALAFFRSPIFIAIAAGSAWSVAGLPVTGMAVLPLFDAVQIVAKANTLLVTLLVGVSLGFDRLREIAGIAAAVLVLKLVASPLLIALPAHYVALEAWQLQVLVIESAMPSAMLSVAFAKRYGCDVALASKLVFATLLGSMVTVTVMMRLLG